MNPILKISQDFIDIILKIAKIHAEELHHNLHERLSIINMFTPQVEGFPVNFQAPLLKLNVSLPGRDGLGENACGTCG